MNQTQQIVAWILGLIIKCSLRNKKEIKRYRCMLLMSKQIKEILEKSRI